jgi:secondary thiamine-phosphate synthase enzyme
MLPPKNVEFTVTTSARCELVDITAQIERAVGQTELVDGVVYVFVPHTTAGVTIQENADPDVKHDLLAKLEQLVPHRESYYRHGEGNSDSHLKTAMVGSSEVIFAEKHTARPRPRLRLGQWQGVYLAEFDGPRERKVLLKICDFGRTKTD